LTTRHEQTQPGTPSLPSSEESTLSSGPLAVRHEASNSRPSKPSTADDRATISKSLRIKGEIIASESLYIEGDVEGAIIQSDNRVTISHNAHVSANITAREVVIFGKVRGNIYASDRVDLRSEGSLSGDVTAERISIGEGAFLKGGIDISKPNRQKDRTGNAGFSASGSQTAA
jgi:cytoskeletal protein CcmA (bactofilin family)